MLSDQIWLWARNFQNGGPHLELLRRLAHWLMKEPELEEEALRATARGQEITIERQSLKVDKFTVVAAFPSGKKETYVLEPAEPGISRAKVKVDELGLFTITEGDLTTLVNVGVENPREFREVVSTLDPLRPLVEATGGTVRRIAASGDAVNIPRFSSMRESPVYGGSDYVGVKRTGASVVTGVGVAPLAVGFLGLLILLGGVLRGLAVGRAETKGALAGASHGCEGPCRSERSPPRALTPPCAPGRRRLRRRPATSSQISTRRRIDRARQRQAAERHALEAEAAVIGLVADEHRRASVPRRARRRASAWRAPRRCRASGRPARR